MKKRARERGGGVTVTSVRTGAVTEFGDDGAVGMLPSGDRIVRPVVIADVLAAAHLTHLVVSPFRERGGIMLVSYPQSLKSTLIKTLRQFPDASVISDINAQQMGEMRDAMCQGKVRTVAFDEFNKLYQRNATTAANLEGMIMAVVAQGWTGPATKHQEASIDEARCLVIGGVTKAIYEHRLKEWIETGFAQRWLWCFYKLSDPSVVGTAIRDQRPIMLQGALWGQAHSPIPFDVDVADRDEIRTWVGHQHGGDRIPFALLLKIAAVLRWHYESDARTAGQQMHMMVLREFAGMLENKYALVDVSGSFARAAYGA